jgi:RHS repeat-associated protein
LTAVSRLQSQSDPVTGFTTTFTYDQLGRPLTRASGSDLRIDRTYEPDTGRIDTQTASKGKLTYARFALTYNRVGAVNHREEWLWDAGTTNPSSSAGAYAGSRPWDYTYGGAGRMLTATGPFPTNYPAAPPAATYASATVSYAYDGQGNRTQMTVGSTTTTWTTDPQGWITGSDAGTPATSSDDLTYAYDPAGELTEITKGATTIETFAYDAWGRTTSASATGATGAIDYGLDALGRTIFRTEGSGRTDLAYVGSSEDLAKESPVGGTSTTYAFTPGGLLASKTSSVTQMAIGDLHGDVVGSITKSGTDLSTATWYSPYGEQAPMESIPSRLGYQGDITAPDTGAVDMLTRQYLPELGRFTTRDILFGHPRDPMTLNQFSYAG